MARRVVVLDTNVIVSATLTDGVCREIVESWITGNSFELAMCPYLFGELARVMGRPKIRRYISRQLADAVLGLIVVDAQWHQDPIRVSPRTRDSSDDPVVQFASDVSAELFVSGDDDLFTPQVAQVVRVVRPVEALLIVRGWHS